MIYYNDFKLTHNDNSIYGIPLKLASVIMNYN